MNHKIFITLLLRLILLILIQSPSNLEIHFSASFSIDSNLLLLNSLLSFNRDEAKCGAYLLTSPSQGVPFWTLCTFYNLFQQRNWYWSIKWGLHRLIHLTHLILCSFNWGLYHSQEHFHTLLAYEFSPPDVDPLLTNDFLIPCFPNQPSHPRTQ